MVAEKKVYHKFYHVYLHDYMDKLNGNVCNTSIKTAWMRTIDCYQSHKNTLELFDLGEFTNRVYIPDHENLHN